MNCQPDRILQLPPASLPRLRPGCLSCIGNIMFAQDDHGARMVSAPPSLSTNASETCGLESSPVHNRPLFNRDLIFVKPPRNRNALPYFAQGWNRTRRVEEPMPETGCGFFTLWNQPPNLSHPSLPVLLPCASSEVVPLRRERFHFKARI